MVKKYFYLILVLILIIGGYLRIVNLDKIPPHLGNDEISIAFDSYSVREIGKDEHGNWWPLAFESYATFKAPLYAYLNMPINWFLGNSEYGVRLLSALAGLIAILLVAILGKLWANEKVGLLAAIILALNPKSIFASRIAFESNVALVFLTLGILTMFLYKEKKTIFLAVLSGLFLGLSIWGYHTEWGLAPMVAVVLPWLSRKEIKLKRWVGMWVVLMVVTWPIFCNFATIQSKVGSNRANSQLWIKEAGLSDYIKNSDDKLLKKTITIAIVPVSNYLQHFGFDSMFGDGADLFKGESPLESGWFLWATLPFLILGLINTKKIYGRNSRWLLAWWLLCPIVPALTYGGVASVRNLAFLMPTVLIMAAGFNRKIIWKGLFLFNFFIFGLAYFVHYPIDSGDGFQYGYKQAWEFMKPNIDKYNKVIVETKFGNYGQYAGLPHLYFGYFGAFRVDEMQKKEINSEETKIDKFHFKFVDWNKEIVEKKSLYVVSVINPVVGAAFDKVNLVSKIEKPNHEVQFLVYESKE